MPKNALSNTPTSVALIGNSDLGNSYAKTIINHRPDIHLKYIYPENNNIDHKNKSKILDIKSILKDPSVKIIILAEQNLQLIKLACEYNKSIFILPPITQSLNHFYQTKFLLTNTETSYHIPINSKTHTPFQGFKNKIFSQKEQAEISFINISHQIDNYDNYWATTNLYDIDLIKWLTDSEISEIYTKQTPKALFIQFALTNNCLCNLEITLSHCSNKSHPNIEVQTLDQSYHFSQISEPEHLEQESHFNPNTQSMHLNQLINNNNIKSIEHVFKLLSIQIAAKQSLKENKPIRISSILSHFKCAQGSILPINYLDN